MDMASHSFGASDRKESGTHIMLQVRQSALEARVSARCLQEGCPWQNLGHYSNLSGKDVLAESVVLFALQVSI